MSVARRMYLVWENATLQTIFGVIAGLVGTFLDGRYFSALSLALTYVLARSKALSGLEVRVKIFTHVFTMLLSAGLLYWMGVELNQSKPHTYTPADYAEAVRNKMPLPIVQQVTNLYENHVENAVPGVLRTPYVVLGGWKNGTHNMQGFSAETDATNTGDAPALNVRTTTKGYFLAKSTSSESKMFEELGKRAFDLDAPVNDLAPGAAYLRKHPVYVPYPNAEEGQAYLNRQKVLYLVQIVTYEDSAKRRYVAELCEYSESGVGKYMYCDGHNFTRPFTRGATF